MSKIPELREKIPLPEEVFQAGLDGNLILFVGAGASQLLELPSWQELAKLALEDLREESLLNYSKIEQLHTLDAKKQLSIAKLIAEQNNYELNLCKHMPKKEEGNSVYKAINDIGCPCVTTNYDELLSPRFFKKGDGSETSVQTIRVAERGKFFARLLNEPGTVVHLHGCVSKPETMIVTTKDYLEHYDDDNVKEFLEQLFKKKIVVFLGYGLEELEILEHILRWGGANKTEETRSQRRRFSLQGFFRSQSFLYESLYNYYERSFGVYLLGFVRDHEDYLGLQTTIKEWVSQIEIREPSLVEDVEFMDEVLG